MAKLKNEIMAMGIAVNMICVNLFGKMTPLLYMVLGLMGLDLMTHIYGASISNQMGVESKKIAKGLYQKIGLCFLILLSLILDYGVKFLGDLLNLKWYRQILFTNLTLGWLFTRELISNLENLQMAGIELPNFILKALNKTKEEVENKGEDIAQQIEN